MTALPDSPHDRGTASDARPEHSSHAVSPSSDNLGSEGKATSPQPLDELSSKRRWGKSLLGGSIITVAAFGLLAAGLTFWVTGQPREDRSTAQTGEGSPSQIQRPDQPVKLDARASA